MEQFESKILGEYLSKYSAAERSHIEYLLRNSKYIPLSELLGKLDTLIEIYMSKHENFYLYENQYKWGSENWLATVFYDKLKRPQIVTSRWRSKKEPTILIIDDCIHSGGNIGRTINDITVGFQGTKVNIDVICAYSTRSGAEYVMSQSMGQNLNLYIGEYIPNVVEIVQRDMYQMDWKFFNKICFHDWGHFGKSRDDEPIEAISLIWFEHKMPAHNSRISGILKNIVSEAPKTQYVTESKKKKGMFTYASLQT